MNGPTALQLAIRRWRELFLEVAPVRVPTMNELPPAASSPLDATPFLGRSADSAYEQLEARRTELCQRLEASLAARGVNGLVVQSPPRASECWVRIVCWTPQESGGPDVALRRAVKFTLLVHENRRFPVEYQVLVSGAGADRLVTAVHSLRDWDIERLISFATGPGIRIRKGHFKRFLAPGGNLIEVITLPRNRPVGLKRRFIATWRRFWLGYLLLGVAVTAAPLNILLALPGLLIMATSVVLRVIYPVILEKRGIRPLGEPRSLLKYDSWQAVVPDIGDAAEALRTSVVRDLNDGRHPSARIESEKIWHWGLDALVEREQIVLHFRRTVVFVEIHGYGADLYVDWESYLNFGVWSEVPSATGFEPGGKVPIIFHEVKPDVRLIGEYDLSDANFALEWVHATVKRHLKRLLAERKIDEDIDFRIIREDRTSVRQSQPAKADGKPRGRFRVTGGAGA